MDLQLTLTINEVCLIVRHYSYKLLILKDIQVIVVLTTDDYINRFFDFLSISHIL